MLDEPVWNGTNEGAYPYQEALDLFKRAYIDHEDVKVRTFFPGTHENVTANEVGNRSMIIGNSLFAPRVIEENGRRYFTLDFCGNFRKLNFPITGNKIDITEMEDAEVLELAKRFLDMTNEEVMSEYNPQSGSTFERPEIKMALRCYDEVMSAKREDGVAPTFTCAEFNIESGLNVYLPETHGKHDFHHNVGVEFDIVGKEIVVRSTREGTFAVGFKNDKFTGIRAYEEPEDGSIEKRLFNVCKGFVEPTITLSSISNMPRNEHEQE